MALATEQTTVGQMGPAPGTAAPIVAKPHLIEGTDPIYLAKLYPKEAMEGGKALENAAIAAGEAAHAAGEHLIAAQQAEENSPTPEPLAPRPPPEPAPASTKHR
jgi:hypothetical protein